MEDIKDFFLEWNSCYANEEPLPDFRSPHSEDEWDTIGFLNGLASASDSAIRGLDILRADDKVKESLAQAAGLRLPKMSLVTALICSVIALYHYRTDALQSQNEGPSGISLYFVLP